MQKEIEKIFVDLIQKSLNLPNNYGTDENGNIIPCVTIKAQNIKLFNTPHIQITVSTSQSNVFANRKEYFETNEKDPETEVAITRFFERLMLNDQRVMQIDVYSRNNEARQRFAEIQACLTSTLAENYANLYQFRISKISNAFNLSGLDGGSDINRYSIRFNCLHWFEKINEIDYYETFPTTAQANAESTFADFTIDKNTVIIQK